MAVFDSYITTVTSILLTVIGFIGNSISIHILTRPVFIKVPMFRYFLFCEIKNLIYFVYMWTWYVPNRFEWMIPSMFCKLWEYIGYVMYTMLSWVSVLNSIDRLLSFKYSDKYDFRKKFKYQALAVATILLLSMITNVPFYLYFVVTNSTICHIQDQEAVFYIYLVNSFISNIIPFIIMTVSTILILKHLVSKKRATHPNTTDFKREKQ